MKIIFLVIAISLNTFSADMSLTQPGIANPLTGSSQWRPSEFRIVQPRGGSVEDTTTAGADPDYTTGRMRATLPEEVPLAENGRVVVDDNGNEVDSQNIQTTDSTSPQAPSLVETGTSGAAAAIVRGGLPMADRRAVPTGPLTDSATVAGPDAPPPAEVVAPQAQASPAQAPSDENTPVDQDELEDRIINFDEDSCEWVEDMPRRIHEAPGCGRGRSTKICVGYVVCNRTDAAGGVDAPKFIRASTCSEENCGDATACTKDRHFWSNPISSEADQKYLRRNIRDLINGGASRQ